MGDRVKQILAKYRDRELAQLLVRRIGELAEGLPRIRIMHVCGTHEWTITHWGIRWLLPENIEVRAGPGCPVCVTPSSDIDDAVRLALEGIRILTYGDMSGAKGSRRLSLEDSRALGGRVEVVYSFSDAVQAASRNPSEEYVFLGAGFETTAPLTAYEVFRGRIPSNLSIISSYRYVPPAVGLLAEADDLEIDAFINPGHASTISGMKAYAEYFERCRKPMVFAGFEPIDVLLAIYLILKQIRDRRPRMENEYRRSVTWEGNLRAQRFLGEVFNLEESYWRGVAMVPEGGMAFKERFREIDARERYGLGRGGGDSFPAEARCADVIKGKIDPPECPLYMRECKPSTPIGPNMVGVEGTCRIWAQHRVTGLRCRGGVCVFSGEPKIPRRSV